ncbi:MAG: hypothetical protein ABL934_06210 [Lysobacteraceae bacterium]
MSGIASIQPASAITCNAFCAILIVGLKRDGKRHTSFACRYYRVGSTALS